MKTRLLKKLNLTILMLLVAITGLHAQNFTEMTVSMEGASSSSMDYSDVDNDGDIDVLISGLDAAAANRLTKLYLNDGNGNYSEVAGTPFPGFTIGDLAFSDVDGDGDEDVMISGEDSTFTGITKLYLNDGSGGFTEVSGTPFPGLIGAAIGFSDVDNDGDNDVLITGLLVSPLTYFARLYTNDGSGVFTEVAGTPFTVAWDGRVKFMDIDNDGDEDVLLTGRNPSDALPANPTLYTNDGGTFTEVTGTSFNKAIFSSVTFEDMDGDGDGDILISGQDETFFPKTSLYINDGSGVFTEDTSNPFPDVDFASNAFSDIDNDGDLDVIFTGINSSFVGTTVLFTNDGNGVFTEVSGEPFLNTSNGTIAFFDADGDNVDDVLITGTDAVDFSGTTRLYINNTVLSVSDFFLENTVVYPNPVQDGIINIQFPSNQLNQIQSIKLYDTNGRLLFSQNITIEDVSYSMNLSSILSQGIYLIEISNNNKKVVKKIVVQ